MNDDKRKRGAGIASMTRRIRYTRRDNSKHSTLLCSAAQMCPVDCANNIIPDVRATALQRRRSGTRKHLAGTNWLVNNNDDGGANARFR